LGLFVFGAVEHAEVVRLETAPKTAAFNVTNQTANNLSRIVAEVFSLLSQDYALMADFYSLFLVITKTPYKVSWNHANSL